MQNLTERYIITKRYKGISGEVVGYAIKGEISQVEKFVNNQEAINIANYVINAQLTVTNKFRALPGYQIETIVDNSNLLVHKRHNKITTKYESEIKEEIYYGQYYIEICRTIRKLAIEGKVKISTNKHASNGGRNDNMFKLIEACGLTVEEFITGYLSVIQPYSLQPFQNKSKDKNLSKTDIWVVDIGYKAKILIKIANVSKNSNQAVVVSFHESNISGITIRGTSDFKDKLCAVLVDRISGKQGNSFAIQYTVQRGFIRYTINSLTQQLSKTNDIALVAYRDIETQITLSMQKIINELGELYYNNNIQSMQPIINSLGLDKISFLSYGYNLVNNINLIIDLFSSNTSTFSRQILSDLAMNLIDEMTPNFKKELKMALKAKFGDYRNALYNTIQNRL